MTITELLYKIYLSSEKNWNNKTNLSESIDDLSLFINQTFRSL